jgi:hypothetical protein
MKTIKLSPAQEHAMQLMRARGCLWWGPREPTMVALQRKGVVAIEADPKNSKFSVKWVAV